MLFLMQLVVLAKLLRLLDLVLRLLLLLCVLTKGRALILDWTAKLPRSLERCCSCREGRAFLLHE